MQRRRVALQELLLQFLLITSTIRAVSYSIKSATPARCQKFNGTLNFARIAIAILVDHLYYTSNLLFHKNRGVAKATPLPISIINKFELFKSNLSTLSFKLSLDVFSFILRSTLFNNLRSTINNFFSFLKT